MITALSAIAGVALIGSAACLAIGIGGYMALEVYEATHGTE